MFDFWFVRSLFTSKTHAEVYSPEECVVLDFIRPILAQSLLVTGAQGQNQSS